MWQESCLYRRSPRAPGHARNAPAQAGWGTPETARGERLRGGGEPPNKVLLGKCEQNPRDYLFTGLPATPADILPRIIAQGHRQHTNLNQSGRIGRIVRFSS